MGCNQKSAHKQWERLNRQKRSDAALQPVKHAAPEFGSVPKNAKAPRPEWDWWWNKAYFGQYRLQKEKVGSC